ncbi:MAG: hypothetical protein AB7U73_17440 [Pirellulales bacterium]
MQTIRIVQKTSADGTLSLQIPLGKPEVECEVLVVVDVTGNNRLPKDRDWPNGYFDLAGSLADDTFFRHPQGEWQ